MDLLTASSRAHSRRRSLRRAVQLEVDVMCDLWHGAVPLVATNLSLHGAWLEADLALSLGDELRLAFDPPRWSGLPRLQTAATVTRVSLLRRRRDAGRPGMGLCFGELSATTRRCLDHALRGLPPPLPSVRDALDDELRCDDDPALVRLGDSTRYEPLGDDTSALLQLDDGACYWLCAEGPLLSSGRPQRRVQPVTAPVPRRHFWLEPRAHKQAALFARSPMTAILAQPRRYSHCALG
jgi:hypothetical protein